MYIFLFFPDRIRKFFARIFLPRRNPGKNCRRPDTRQGKAALRKAQEEGNPPKASQRLKNARKIRQSLAQDSPLVTPMAVPQTRVEDFPAFPAGRAAATQNFLSAKIF
jgi:hypothetical protein